MNLIKRLSITVSFVSLGLVSQAAEKPNIVFIMADDLGAGWVDYDGSHPEINTPHLQRLAESGMVFTRAYATASVCSPTRAACITGMSSAQIGMTTHIPGVAGRERPGPNGWRTRSARCWKAASGCPWLSAGPE